MSSWDFVKTQEIDEEISEGSLRHETFGELLDFKDN